MHVQEKKDNVRLDIFWDLRIDGVQNPRERLSLEREEGCDECR